MDTAKTAKVLDVVCGMRIDPSAARETKMHNGKQYHFCSHLCAVKFEHESERYLGSGTAHTP